MTERAYYVAPVSTINEIMAPMIDNKIRHLPVLDANHRIVGIILIGDARNDGRARFHRLPAPGLYHDVEVQSVAERSRD